MVVESVFQGSKVFEKGGPFTDIYELPGNAAKKDERLRNSGVLIGFDLLGDKWELEPKTAFYDWLYINAVHQNPKLGEQLEQFNGFSDIEFNPEKSINCQARSAALYVSLNNQGLLKEALLSKEHYLKILAHENGDQSLNQSALPGF